MIKVTQAWPRSLLCLLVGSVVSGCGGYPEVKKTVDQEFADARHRQALERQQAPLRAERSAAYVQDRKGVFLGRKAIARRLDEELPAQFARVTINQPGQYNLQQAAQILTEATGLPVTLAADVSLATSHGGMAAAGAPAGGPAMNGGSQGGALGALGAAQGPAAQAALLQQFPISLTYRDLPLASILDGIGAAAGGLSWEYKHGRIVFYRYVTRTFVLSIPNGEYATSMAIGKSSTIATGVTGGSSSQTNGSGTSAFQTVYTVQSNAWKEIVDTLQKSILSPTGKVFGTSTSNTLTVMDGRRQVELAEQFIDDQNRIFSRQVAIRIEIMTIRSADQSDFGIDWTAVLSRLNANGNNQVFSFTSPTGTAVTGAGAVGIKLLKQVNGQADWSGSQALIKALATESRAVLSRSFETLALNRRVTPVASIRSQSYIAATTPAPSTVSGTAGGTPGLTPGSVSYGFVLNMVPTITSRNSLVLDFGMDLSDLTALSKESSGQQSIQLPETIAQQFMNSVAINTGETLVISGLDTDTQRYDQKTLGRGVSPGLGGNFSGTSERQSVVVLLTPVVAGF